VMYAALNRPTRCTPGLDKAGMGWRNGTGRSTPAAFVDGSKLSKRGRAGGWHKAQMFRGKRRRCSPPQRRLRLAGREGCNTRTEEGEGRIVDNEASWSSTKDGSGHGGEVRGRDLPSQMKARSVYAVLPETVVITTAARHAGVVFQKTRCAVGGGEPAQNAGAGLALGRDGCQPLAGSGLTPRHRAVDPNPWRTA